MNQVWVLGNLRIAAMNSNNRCDTWRGFGANSNTCPTFGNNICVECVIPYICDLSSQEHKGYQLVTMFHPCRRNVIHNSKVGYDYYLARVGGWRDVEVRIIEPNLEKGAVAHGERGSLVKLAFLSRIVVPRSHLMLLANWCVLISQRGTTSLERRHWRNPLMHFVSKLEMMCTFKYYLGHQSEQTFLTQESPSKPLGIEIHFYFTLKKILELITLKALIMQKKSKIMLLRNGSITPDQTLKTVTPSSGTHSCRPNMSQWSIYWSI